MPNLGNATENANNARQTSMLLGRVDAMIAQSRHAQAVEVLQSSLASSGYSDSDRARLLYRLGFSQVATGSAGGMETLQGALASGLLPPIEKSVAHFGQGRHLFNKGAYQDAAEALRAALQANDGQDHAFEARTRNELAISLYVGGQKQDAITELLAAQTSGRLDPKGQALVKYITGEIDLDQNLKRQEAADLLQSAIESGHLPKYFEAQAHFRLAGVGLATQNFDDAARNYLAALTIGKLPPEQQALSYHWLGGAYYRTMQYQKSAEAYQQALATGLLNERSSAFAHYGLGMSQFSLGQDTAANESLRLALSSQQVLTPDLIARAQRIRSNYAQGGVANAGLSSEDDPEKKLQKTLHDIYAMGGQPLDTARLGEWKTAISEHLPVEAFTVFFKLLERTYAENNKVRGDRHLLAKDMLPVLDRMLRNPGYLQGIASEVQPDSQRACVNQPMASWSRVAALVQFYDASRADPSLAGALTAARSLRGRAAVATYAAEELARERRNVDDPTRYSSVEVEFLNELERLVNQSRMTMGMPAWLGVSEVVPYAQAITSMTTPRRVHEAVRAVESAENVSHETLVDWLTDGPHADTWQTYLRSVRPDTYATIEERYVDLVEAAATHAARTTVMQQREMELKAVTRDLTSSAVIQSASPRRTTWWR
ncbi:tetratricopeptide repeat protein [Cupriavidus necator]